MTGFVFLVVNYLYIFNISKTCLFPDHPSWDSSHCLIFRNQNDNIAILYAFQEILWV